MTDYFQKWWLYGENRLDVNTKLRRWDQYFNVFKMVIYSINVLNRSALTNMQLIA